MLVPADRAKFACFFTRFSELRRALLHCIKELNFVGLTLDALA